VKYFSSDLVPAHTLDTRYSETPTDAQFEAEGEIRLHTDEAAILS